MIGCGRSCAASVRSTTCGLRNVSGEFKPERASNQRAFFSERHESMMIVCAHGVLIRLPRHEVSRLSRSEAGWNRHGTQPWRKVANNGDADAR